MSKKIILIFSLLVCEYQFFPDVPWRLAIKSLAPSHWTCQFLTGHGKFNAKLFALGKFILRPDCSCGYAEQDVNHVMWDYPEMKSERAELFLIVRPHTGPIDYADLIATKANITAFENFTVGKIQRKFPDNFQFGTASSAYQIEGAWNKDGKGESIWDHFVHGNTNNIFDGTTGDIACDSYKNYKRDIEMLKEIGAQFYRFSISWPRILPGGFINKKNQKGIDYYNNLIDEIIANGITPLVTIYHWDLPQRLQDLGGFANSKFVDYFTDYAKLLFTLYGDRVKHWITFNEPLEICTNGYGLPLLAPAMNISGIAEYLCGHNLLLAHAKAYHLYADEFKETQHGSVTLSLSSCWYEPGDHTPASKIASKNGMQFEMGWFGHPIFSKDGDYPKVMRLLIDKKSKEQGFHTSRLPVFTPEEIEYIKGTADYFGLNHYTSSLVKRRTKKDKDMFPVPSHSDDLGVIPYVDPNWKTAKSYWLKVVPWGFTKVLEWIKVQYHNPEVVIFENGYSDSGLLDDDDRIDYLRQYLNAVLDAIDAGSNVTKYTVWSLMDNFEWIFGYRDRFGLFQVDFNSPKKTRKAKKSAMFFKNLTLSKIIPMD